jgi:hypothetical protein
MTPTVLAATTPVRSTSPPMPVLTEALKILRDPGWQPPDSDRITPTQALIRCVRGSPETANMAGIAKELTRPSSACGVDYGVEGAMTRAGAPPAPGEEKRKGFEDPLVPNYARFLEDQTLLFQHDPEIRKIAQAALLAFDEFITKFGNGSGEKSAMWYLFFETPLPGNFRVSRPVTLPKEPNRFLVFAREIRLKTTAQGVPVAKDTVYQLRAALKRYLRSVFRALPADVQIRMRLNDLLILPAPDRNSTSKDRVFMYKTANDSRS